MLTCCGAPPELRGEKDQAQFSLTTLLDLGGLVHLSQLPVASRQVFMDRYAAPTRQGGLPAVGPECKVLTAKLLGTVLLSVLHKPWINTRGNSFAVFRF